jgi:linoleoyl-CoA desaturase
VEEDNLFTRVFMGCFNYHVAHHLFPNVNHIYYPEITEKLRGYAAQYGLPYRRLRLISALYGHYKLIRKNGKIDDFNIWEESM